MGCLQIKSHACEEEETEKWIKYNDDAGKKTNIDDEVTAIIDHLDQCWFQLIGFELFESFSGVEKSIRNSKI